MNIKFTGYQTMTNKSGSEELCVEVNRVAEITLISEKTFQNPFTDIEIDAVITHSNEGQLRVPVFWAGENRWCFRYAAKSSGRFSWRIECSDPSSCKLHGVEGNGEVVDGDDDNPLYRHGPIRVAEDRRHFEHADGTPFFWLADTWWKGLCERIRWEGFQKLTADRKAKGYTVVQIIGGGPYPDEPPFDPRWRNEGGMPYEQGYERVNPEYFDYADRRIAHLVEAGIMPAIVGGWAWYSPGYVSNLTAGTENMTRHWRYLIARYGAYPVAWIIAGEMRDPKWAEVARYVRELDPYHRLSTMHPPGIPELQSGRKALDDDELLDFDLLQTAHNDWASAPITVSQVTSAYSKTPIMPVVNGEVVYEWHKDAGRHDIQRFMFWTCMLSGTAGHTYGAGGVWQMNSESVHGSDAYERTPWHVAMHFPGSAQLGLGKKLLEEYPWWRFEPHPEWISPHSTTLFEPHEDWYDNHKKWAEFDGRADFPYAAGIPREVRFIYIPGNDLYRMDAPTVRNLEPDVHYHAFLFDPIWGRRFDLGDVETSTESSSGSPEYHPPQLPSPQDWVMVLERTKDQNTGDIFMEDKSLTPTAHGGEVGQWQVFEATYKTTKQYSNPFTDVEVDVVFQHRDRKWTVPAFWAGDDKWSVRFAPPDKGEYTYRVECTDKANIGLNGNERTLRVGAYHGQNPLLEHGFLKTSANGRHFEHADGTPFLWLGDTWWKNLCKRLTWEGFRELTADRKAKGFTVVQIVCGPYPDEGAFEPRWENEGGKPYETHDFSVVNPGYFDYADRRIKHLIDAGIVPAIVGGWGRHDCDGMAMVGVEGFKRHWRHLVARYGAYPVVWILGGEIADSVKWGEGPWADVARYLRRVDPYKHLLACHTSPGQGRASSGELVIDYDMIGGNHDGKIAVSGETLNILTSAYSQTPSIPVLCGETAYEGHMQHNFQDVQRHLFWMYMLSGAAGHTYGAAGVWHASVESDPGITPVYDLTTWREGMAFPGSTQLGLGRKLLERFSWWRFEPHPEWAESDSFAAGIPGEVRVIYQPRREIYNWDGPTVKKLESGVSYSAFLFNPVDGKRYQVEMTIDGDEYSLSRLPSPQDWVLVLERS